MEVLFITHKYPPSIGGMEKQSYELINGVAKFCKVHSLIYDNRSNRIKFLITITSRVKKVLKENPNISVIHLNDGLMAFFGAFLKRITNIPIIVTLHGLDIVLPSKLFQKIVVGQFKKLDGVIAVSQATANECIDRGFSKEKVYVVRNGVDTDLAYINKEPGFIKYFEKKLNKPISDKKILVSIGRSVRRKGFSWFMTEVLPKLDNNIIYLIIGPPQRHIRKINFILNLLPARLSHLISLSLGLGIDEIDIQNALKKPTIKNRAFYLGKLPFKEMVQILKHADLYVMPNIKIMGDAEGFGLVALEASVNGLPVLASAIEGITCAVINEKNGYLAPPENEKIWIEMISSLLSDCRKLKKFGESAKKYTIDNYEWKKMVAGYLDVFNIYNLIYLNQEKKTILNEETHREAADSLAWDGYAKKNA